MTAEVGQAFEQAADCFLGIMVLEVVDAEIGVFDGVPTHEVSRREYRGSHSEGRLFGAYPNFCVRGIN